MAMGGLAGMNEGGSYGKREGQGSYHEELRRFVGP
jgi:hypothetical protein